MTQRKLPVPPNVVMNVTQTAANPKSSSMDLAVILEADPVLSANMIKAVNSPLYSPRSRIATVSRAVSFMGINAVRNLVLCLAIREIFPRSKGFPLELFWECSLRRAVAARAMGRLLGFPKAEELFTMSLCQDLGVLVIAQEEAVTAPMADVMGLAWPDRLAIEDIAGERHDDLGFVLFNEWKFPEEMSVPVKYHHRPDEAPAEHARRTNLAHAAECIADMLQVEDKQASLEAAEAALARLDLPPERLQPLADEVAVGVSEAADVLGMKVGAQPSYEEITALASQGLVAISMDLQEQTARLQRTLDEQQRMTQRLNELNEELEERATTDGLTKLPNRRAFDETLEREISRAQRQSHPLTLCMLDVDHFKLFNDTYGHQAGDLVLQQVGEVMNESVRQADYPARYGGEEFSVIMPFIDGPKARFGAERIRKNIESMRVNYKGRVLKVTVSIGCATVAGKSVAYSPEELIKEADEALYRAKEAGRNRVVVG